MSKASTLFRPNCIWKPKSEYGDYKMKTENTAYFKNGILYDVNPRNTDLSIYEDRGVAYAARYIVSDGVEYDLYDAASVKMIPVPRLIENEACRPTSLDYILRMCAGNIRDFDHRQSIVVMEKAIQLMYSSRSWTYDDYMRIVMWLYEDGRIDEAIASEEAIRNNNNILSRYNLAKILNDKFKKLIESADIISLESEICCEKCAIYSGRIYRTGNKFLNYPMLPQELRENGYYHIGCKVSAWDAVFDDESKQILYLGRYVNAVDSTRRPYIDARSEADKEAYREQLNRINSQRINDEILDDVKKEFYLLKYLAADICPKSKYAYEKLKRENGEEFAKLKSLAQNRNITIKSLDDYKSI